LFGQREASPRIAIPYLRLSRAAQSWRFSPKILSEQHAEALERALWTAIRKLKERVVLHKELVERRKRNKGEDELKKRLEKCVATAGNDLKLLREILERI
jgi:hypothetical protein